MIARTLYENGFRELVSVIPPGASLSPLTKIKPESRGKSPGIRYANGTWGGYDWLNKEADLDAMVATNANVGLKAGRFPGVDLDVYDETLAAILRDIVLDVLGNAPTRIGRPPKALLMYRLADGEEPFGRIALTITGGKREHLVEVLGEGRQYLVAGTHPSGIPYTWDTAIEELTPDDLQPITLAAVERLFARIEDDLPVLGYAVTRVGTGRAPGKSDVNQSDLRAPSLLALEEALSFIPNTNDLFPDRDDYIKMGVAIRAAGGDEAEPLFIDWACSWEGNDRNPKGNDPATAAGDWRRIGPPYRIGWNWIAELAKQYGYNDAANDFEAMVEPIRQLEEGVPHDESEDGLALKVVEEHGDFIRYDAVSKRWMVWDNVRWAPDALGLANERVSQTLRRVADRILRDEGRKNAVSTAQRLGSATVRDNILRLVKTNPAIAARPEHFDHDGWLLNTPGGTVNLKSGEITPPSPVQLLTKATRVGPDFDMKATRWKRFLAETTDNDPEMEDYLQRIAGYALSGSTKEQVFFFIWGPGGNGKSVFLNALTQILGDYAKQAPMDTFSASHGDRHPTDLASLQGARLVAASETQAGKRWDEAKMKALTGGEPISARFMRGDFFQYTPHFKLVFVGNHKPQIRDIDAAMRRRVILVPFTTTPKVIDKELSRKLEAEYPAILAWMITGCIKWQNSGLVPSERIRIATQEYFEDEDAVGRWMAEHVIRTDGNEDFISTADLFTSWSHWANAEGEYAGSSRRLTQALIQKGLTRGKADRGAVRGFRGIQLKEGVTQW